MATKRELISRWEREPGQTILRRINDFFFGLQMPGHGRRSEEVFAMLEGLPYRDEVPNGRDLRGAGLGGGVHELDFRECDFSYARMEINLVNCDLTGARFDEASNAGSLILKTLTRASFRRAKLNGGFFEGAQAQQCDFERAVLTGASFEGADLTGSSFREANCKRAKFLRAVLIGCDFSKAILDEAVFQEVHLDKSTDLRGASLVNLYHLDHRDRAGNLVVRGTDWRQATYDASTVTGEDPAASALELLDKTISLQNELPVESRDKVLAVLEKYRTALRQQFNANWYEKLLAELSDNERQQVETLIERASEALL